MKLIRSVKYARHTQEVEELFLRACKTEAKWTRILNKVGTKGDMPPVLDMKRVQRRAVSIQKKLGKLGFGVET